MERTTIMVDCFFADSWGVRQSCYFEPTLFIWDSYIFKLMSCLHRVDGRCLCAVTHLALLGVKMQETAFWVFAKDKKTTTLLLMAVMVVFFALNGIRD